MAKIMYLDMIFIKFVMDQKGLTVKDMVERMKLTPATVRRYLNGADQEHMNAVMLFRFAKALDLSIIELLRGEHVEISK